MSGECNECGEHALECECEMTEIPFDTWVNIPCEEINKKGWAQWVYRPSNYKGPLVIDGCFRKEISDIPGTPIILTREEAEIMRPKRYD